MAHKCVFKAFDDLCNNYRTDKMKATAFVTVTHHKSTFPIKIVCIHKTSTKELTEELPLPERSQVSVHKIKEISTTRYISKFKANAVYRNVKSYTY